MLLAIIIIFMHRERDRSGVIRSNPYPPNPDSLRMLSSVSSPSDKIKSNTLCATATGMSALYVNLNNPRQQKKTADLATVKNTEIPPASVMS